MKLANSVGVPAGSLADRGLRALERCVDSGAMGDRSAFTSEQARVAGEQIGIDWTTSQFDVEQLRTGMDVELEHGTQDMETNVTDDDVIVTAKIARAHLNEFPDYYSRLAVMEAEAEAFWASKGA
jgi:DNA-directed RNA polymerase alpha subunit